MTIEKPRESSEIESEKYNWPKITDNETGEVIDMAFTTACGLAASEPQKFYVETHGEGMSLKRRSDVGVEYYTSDPEEMAILSQLILEK